MSDQAHNVDPAEVHKFDELASRWWDPSGEFKPLHDLNPVRVGFVAERTTIDGCRALDVGCGGGILSEAMARAGAEVTGIDLADKSLKIAKLHGLESGVKVEYRKVPVEELAAEQPGQYDVVTCMEMLEHVPDPASIVRACAALTKPGGWVFFSTLNRNPKAFLFAIIGAEYVLRLLPRGTHTYDMFIKPSELASSARGAGLEPVGMRGMEYNPITQIYSLTSDTSVNYLMATRK